MSSSPRKSRSCLVAYLNCFSDSDAGFEHPIDFYDQDDDAEGTEGSTKLEEDDNETSNRRRRRWYRAGATGMLLLLLLLLLLLMVVWLIAGNNSKKSRSSSASSASREQAGPCHGRKRRRRQQEWHGVGKRDNHNNDNEPAAFLRQGHRFLDTTTSTTFSNQNGLSSINNIGCFRVQPSPDNRTITAATWDARVQACDAACSTHYFAIATHEYYSYNNNNNHNQYRDRDEFDNAEQTVVCYCHVERPKERLSIGPCHRIQVVYDLCDDENDKDNDPQHHQEMEVFFDPRWKPECNQDTSKTVRNFLVEEDDVPFGFDIALSEFRPSPFELYKDECGTNVYEVQTEVSIR